MNKFFKNKKAEKLYVFWWFLFFLIVGGSVALASNSFFSHEINVNLAEARILNSRINDCLINNGFIVLDFLEQDFNLFYFCGIQEKIIDSSNFYLEINLLNFEKESIKEIKRGNSEFEKNCGIISELETKNFPSCYFDERNIFYYQDGEIKSGFLKILTSSNQRGRRVN